MDNDTFASLATYEGSGMDHSSSVSVLPHMAVRDWSWLQYRGWCGLGITILLSMTAAQSVGHSVLTTV
jgi:hypothetical protein